MSKPCVTVAIPTYNRATFLREALHSVLNQTYSDFVVLVSDNASTDESADVVASFKDDRIHYHRHPRNIGMTPNWQFVVSRAETEFVAPLSDDDLYLPDHLERALDALSTFPDAAYFTCPAIRFGDPNVGGELRPIAIEDKTTPLLYFEPREAVRFLGIDNPGPMMTMVCRNHILKNHEIYWGEADYLPQDLLVMTQLMVHGGFVFGNRPTARYRIHGANESYRPNDRALKRRFNCMVWYGVRYLANYLLARGICTLKDIELHGLQARSHQHVVPLVLGLGSFDSPPILRAVAKRVFEARRDMDVYSARFRFARRIGFAAIPISERVTQTLAGWRPR